MNHHLGCFFLFDFFEVLSLVSRLSLNILLILLLTCKPPSVTMALGSLKIKNYEWIRSPGNHPQELHVNMMQHA